MDSFIVELVSSASCDIYPENTLSSFTNFLPDQLFLEGKWEVALLEISHPALYNNVSDGGFFFNLSNRTYEEYESVQPTRKIEPGLYRTVHEVFFAMSEVVSNSIKSDDSTENQIRWETDPRSGKVKITLPHRDAVLSFPRNDLASILGFHQNKILQGPEVHESQFPTDILRIHTVMVYTDIVEYSIVGDTKAPLLRSFPFTQRVSHDAVSVTKYMSCTSFDKLQFHKLLKNSIHSIKIELRSQIGELIPFVSVGLTRLTLMFRKIK